MSGYHGTGEFDLHYDPACPACISNRDKTRPDVQWEEVYAQVDAAHAAPVPPGLDVEPERCPDRCGGRVGHPGPHQSSDYNPTTLDAAWKRAEEALPEGWKLLIGQERGTGTEGWWAIASSSTRNQFLRLGRWNAWNIVSTLKTGTLYIRPTDALNALAARLEGEK